MIMVGLFLFVVWFYHKSSYMPKSTYFFGQSVFGQLIDLIDPATFSQALRISQSDRCYKRFKTWDHLVSMLFGTFSHCSSLREICGAMMGLKGKLEHFGLERVPRRSTLSDSNRRRSSEFFSQLYYGLFKRYGSILSDSRFMQVEGKKISIIDSTTIGLFKDILKCVGRKPVNGKRKGGIKVHTEMVLDDQVPKLVWYSPAATHDITFLQRVNFEKDKVYVFDKGYIDYHFYERLITGQIGFVTRLKASATYQVLKTDYQKGQTAYSMLKDERIELPIREKGQVIRTITLRKVTWWDRSADRVFEAITNMFDMEAENIAVIYKQRWQIECLYKQLKQNFPLKYFLGDNENAITIQIWCVLIANLLLSVIRAQLSRKTAFSCLASNVRVNLINYIHLVRFLNNPEKDWEKEIQNLNQSELFPP